MQSLLMCFLLYMLRPGTLLAYIPPVPTHNSNPPERSHFSSLAPSFRTSQQSFRSLSCPFHIPFASPINTASLLR
jgi:hypothetical protein